jgi:DNA-binding NarL/FixJ family response regulator
VPEARGALAQGLDLADRLGAKGHSNPEIAQALFVTRKTVETHLGHVYRMLDVAGRGQLRAMLPDPYQGI